MFINAPFRNRMATYLPYVSTSILAVHAQPLNYSPLPRFSSSPYHLSLI